MDEAQVIELQTRLAHQEAALHDLSDVVAQQQKQIDRLELKVRALLDRAARAERDMGQGAVRGSAEEEKPPHY